MTYNYPLLAFSWPIDCTALIRPDWGDGSSDTVAAFYPLCFAVPSAPRLLQIDIAHAADVPKLKAAWWLSDHGLEGFIDLNTAPQAGWGLLNAVRTGKFKAVSPESAIISSVTEPGPIIVITEARLNRLALVEESANPDARLWAREEKVTDDFGFVCKEDYVPPSILDGWEAGYDAFMSGSSDVYKP